MSVRLERKNCALVVINSERLMRQSDWVDALAWLSQLTTKLSLPLHVESFNGYSTEKIGGLLTQLRHSIETQRGAKLLIPGADLEEGVSLVALEALAFGFDVFLLADLIRSTDKRIFEHGWARLGCGLIKPEPQSHSGEFCEGQIG